MIQKFKNSQIPLYLSIDVQSLASKHEKLCSFINDLQQNQVLIDVIAVQETWQIINPTTVQIPGFNLFYKTRAFSRGSGVGFYVKDTISTKIIDNLSTFHEKIFESITLEISSNNKKILISNIYRSPSPNLDSTNSFCEKLESLLSNLNLMNSQSILFMDSNINLLNLLTNAGVRNFHDTITNNGFLQLILKSSRIQNNSFSLIDQILTNNNTSNILSGSIINDMSDHFLTFTTFSAHKKEKCQKVIESRNFSPKNVANFKEALGALTWDSTFQQDNMK